MEGYKPITKGDTMTFRQHLALMNLLDWAIGNRGSKECNPYSIPEVKEALEVLAMAQKRKGWGEAVTCPAEGMDKLGRYKPMTP